MKQILKYSVLRYTPSIVAGESINLGMIIFAPEEDYREFYFTKKIQRVTNFDDTVSKKVVGKLLQSIKEEVEDDKFETQPFDIEKYVQFFTNNYCFEKPKALLYDSLNDQVEELKKSYFSFDYKKEDRPTYEDDKKLLDRVISANRDDVKRKRRVKGSVDETISFDFVTSDYKVKLFEFNDKDLRRQINSAKSWAWNCMNDDQIVLVYRYSEEKNPKYQKEFQTIMNIFDTVDAKVYNIEDDLSVLNVK